MRAKPARGVIIAVAMLAVAGCRSGSNSSNWNWGFNRNKAAAANSTLNANNGPTLPSANAAPGAATAPPAVTQGYADQGGAANPYGAQPTGYNNTAPANPYAAAAAAAAPPASNYGAPAATAAAQAGPYSESYGQTAGAAPTGSNYMAPAGGYQVPESQVNPYVNQPTGAPADTAYATPGAASSPPPEAYANTAAPAAAGGYPTDAYGAGAQPPASSYGADPGAGTAYPASEAPAGGDRYAAQPEQAPADRYAAPADRYAAPAGEAPPSDTAQNDQAPPSQPDRYAPGDTGYQPGNTGYSPPGVAPYKPPYDQANVAAGSSRRTPYYRPGGTSDFVAATPAARTPSSSPLDRGVAGSPGDRYTPPAGPPGYEAGGAPVNQANNPYPASGPPPSRY